MIVVIIIAAGYHLIINDSRNALLHPLPLSPSQDDVAQDEDDFGERDFGRQTSSNSATCLRTKERQQPLPAEQQANIDKPKRERTEHEMHVRAAPLNAGAYGKNVTKEGTHKDPPKDFTRPTAIEPQHVVWLPRDPLGVVEAREKDMKQQGIDVSTEKVVMDEKGHVVLNEPPPSGEDDGLFG